MDNFLKKQLYAWTYEKIKDNPLKFGGDKSNPLIMKAYLKEFHTGEQAEQLPTLTFSILSTVSRIKNKLLEKNPQFDFRTKRRPKVKA